MLRTRLGRNVQAYDGDQGPLLHAHGLRLYVRGIFEGWHLEEETPREAEDTP